VRGAWIAAAIFALHPVQVESVAWITERKNVLSGLFYLGSALAFLRFAGIGSQEDEQKKWRDYALAVTLFILALWSKSVTCTLPVALLVILWWKREKFDWERDAVPLLPMLGVGVVLALFTIWMEANKVGAQGKEWALSFFDRFLIAGRAVWFYIFKLVWPDKLTFIYPRWVLDSTALWQWIFPATGLAGLYALWAGRKRLGRAPLVAALFFLVTLSPALGFINYYPMIYSFVADHFAYLACIGPMALVAAGLGRFRIPDSGFRNAPAIVLLTILMLLTWRQAGIYTDIKTLWKDTLKKNPGAWMAHTNLGAELVEEGNLGEADYHFSEAMRLAPGYDNVHYNLGAIRAKQGRREEAIAYYREAIRLNPNSAQAYNNLGKVFAESGEMEMATAHFKRALEIRPDYAKARNNLGILYAGQDRLEEAVDEYAQAIRADPDFFDPHNNLGVVLARQGKLADAVQRFDEAVQLRPDSAEARNNLAYALMKEGRYQEALGHYEEALKLNPALQRARQGAAEARERLGQPR
jgi:tetratricopeptide (TPR) repeat protein